MRKALLLLIPLFCMVQSSSAADSAWPMFQHDCAHSGFNTAASKLDLKAVDRLWAWDDGIIYAPSVAYDLNSDGKLEILIPSVDGFLYALQGDGRALWSYKVNKSLVASPAVLEYEGMKYVGFSSDEAVYLLDFRGSLVWSIPSGRDFSMVPAQVKDVNQDGRPELIFDNVTFMLDGSRKRYSRDYLLNLSVAPPTGSMVEGYAEKVYSGNIFMVPAIADVNNDGMPEVVGVVSWNDDLRMVLKDLSDSVIWVLERNVKSPPVVADLDGDNRKEIIACTTEGNILVVDGRGFVSREIRSGQCLYVIVADLNQDGRMELVETSKAGGVVVYGDARDSDADGLIDFKEDILGTNKFSRDSDNDGLEDAIDSEPMKPRTFREVKSPPPNLKPYLGGLLLAGFLVLLLKLTSSFKKKSAYWNLPEKIRIGKKKIRELTQTREASIKSLAKSKVMMEREWEKLLFEETAAEDVNLAKQILRAVLEKGQVTADEAAGQLRISKIKLAQYCVKLEEKGYLRIDSSKNPGNPVLEATDKLRGLQGSRPT